MNKIILIVLIVVKTVALSYSQNLSGLNLDVQDSLHQTSNNYEEKLFEMKMLLNQKLLDSAEKILLDSTCIFDDQVKYNFLGVISFQKGDLSQAKSYWLKSAENNEFLYQTYKNLGMFYGSTGDIDNAIKSYEHALEIIGEQDNEILLNLAYLYRTRTDFSRALTIWGAIRFTSPRLYVESEVAYIYSLLNETNVAISMFDNVEKNGALKEWGYITLIQLYEEISIVDAMKISKKGLQVYPQSDKIKYEYLRILLDNRLFEDASEFISYNLLETSDNPKIKGLIFDYYISIEDEQKISDLYSDSLALDPESQENLVNYLYKERYFTKIIALDSVNEFSSNEQKIVLAKSYYAVNDIKNYSTVLEEIYNDKYSKIDDSFLLLFGLSKALNSEWSEANSYISSLSTKDGTTQLRILKKIIQLKDSLLLSAVAPSYIVKQIEEKSFSHELNSFINLVDGIPVDDSMIFSDKFMSLNVDEMKGDISFRLGNFKSALHNFIVLGTLDELDTYYMIYKSALCYNRLDKIKKSRNMLKKIDKPIYDDEYLHKILVGFYFASNDEIDKAIAIWQGVEERGVKDFNLSRNLAIAYNQEGNSELSITILKQLYNDNPDSLHILDDISSIYKDMGNEELSQLFKPFERTELDSLSKHELSELYKEKILLEENSVDRELLIFKYYIEFQEYNRAAAFFEKSEYIQDYKLDVSLDYAASLIMIYEFKKSYKFLKKMEYHQSDKLYYLQVVSLCQANKAERSKPIIDKISDDGYKLASELVYNSLSKNCEEAEMNYSQLKAKGYEINFFNIPLRCK